ncbi:cytochrome c oxidase assembly protein [Microvirga sp. BT325]|uniref:Cytochrome c oxidase assembly protein n=2 Tax=Microvirga splendida TaxID=2795727 RepID=A0ABS0Y806_9HYPH|nr:cytochrome c oxidase assembly protein [Microvirga splendida]
MSPVVVLPLVFVSLLYMRGLRVTERGARPTLIQRGLFAAGIGCLVLALVSPLCRIASTLAWAHMVQHVLLVAGAPLFLVLSRPGNVFLAGLPAGLRMTAATWRQAGAPVSQPYAYLFISFVLYGMNIW